jgi:hypothetical protein
MATSSRAVSRTASVAGVAGVRGVPARHRNTVPVPCGAAVAVPAKTARGHRQQSGSTQDQADQVDAHGGIEANPNRCVQVKHAVGDRA